MANWSFFKEANNSTTITRPDGTKETLLREVVELVPDAVGSQVLVKFPGSKRPACNVKTTDVVTIQGAGFGQSTVDALRVALVPAFA
jgi:hypothetical protein